MRKELVISAKRDQVQLALLENQRLVELHQDSQDESLKVGDIILGRVKKVMPGMNAAFIDIGGPRDAFLHYTDMGPLFTTYAYYMHGMHAHVCGLTSIPMAWDAPCMRLMR